MLINHVVRDSRPIGGGTDLRFIGLKVVGFNGMTLGQGCGLIGRHKPHNVDAPYNNIHPLQ
jgi:hypothetical protein